MKIQDTKTVATHFRNNPKFGRTTTLVEKGTGKVLAVGMGAATREQMWKMYQQQIAA
jgi:hypothetical protein